MFWLVFSLIYALGHKHTGSHPVVVTGTPSREAVKNTLHPTVDISISSVGHQEYRRQAEDGNTIYRMLGLDKKDCVK